MQRRITKTLPELANLSYEERLQRRSLSTLLYRRNRMDMIQVFKIIQNIAGIPMDGLFEFSDSQTRGNSKKLYKPKALKTFRLNSFFVRTINKLTSLTDESVLKINITHSQPMKSTNSYLILINDSQKTTHKLTIMEYTISHEKDRCRRQVFGTHQLY